jgi:hypothetical protein
VRGGHCIAVGLGLNGNDEFGLLFTGHGDIGIPNGSAEDGTRGLLKAHESTNTKLGSPISRGYGKIELY